MAIFGFGKAKKLEDLKVEGLKDERVRLQVKQDQMMRRIKAAQEDYDGHFEVAKVQKGLSDAELDIITYKMETSQRRKMAAEGKFQESLTQMQIVDSTLDVLQMRKELEKKGIWKTINNLKEEELEEQIVKLAKDRKGQTLNLNKVAETLGVAGDTIEVHTQRSSNFRRIREEIDNARAATN